MNAPDADRAVHRVAHTLREAILDGDIAAGEPLREQQIAKDLGVSRTPVRQALRLLESEGLVMLRPNRGAVVNTADRTLLLEVAEVRAHLGVLAARRAVENASDADIARIRTLSVAVQEALDRRRTDGAQQISNALMQLHGVLFEISGNTLLSRLFKSTTFVQVVRATFASYDERDWNRISTYCQELPYALEQRDGELAGALVSSYFRLTRRAILNRP